MKPNVQLQRLLKKKGIECETVRDVRRDKNLLLHLGGKEWYIEII